MDWLFKTIVWVVGTLLVVAGALRLTMFDLWQVPHDPVLAMSVEPTLSAGDWVLVLRRGEPGFGELVRCKDPDVPTDFVVGRIAGLGGDSIQMVGKDVKVNQSLYRGEFSCPASTRTVLSDDGEPVEILCDIVSMGGIHHQRGSARKPKAEQTRAKVENGQYFLLSDNRDAHDDSRDFGALPAADCRERIVFRFVGGAGWGDVGRRMSVIQ